MSSQPLTKKRLATLVAGLFLLAGLSWYRFDNVPGDAPEGSTYLSGQTMGTTYSVKVHGEERVDGLQAEIDEHLAEISALMSTYDPGSELSRFNQWDANVPFPLSTDTYAVFDLALRISEETGGKFDITVGPVVNAYGFGPTLDIDLPSYDELNAMRAYVGYRHLRLEPGDRTITKDHVDVYCDLSAIAKGYAVDQIAALLEERDFKNYFVEIGGEVRAKGGNDKGNPNWKVGIEKPVPTIRTLHSQLDLLNASLATSGNYRNFSEVDGVRISHTLDPDSLKPVNDRLRSVSVLHDNCAEADAYATALMVMGADAAQAFAEKHDLAVMLLVAGEDEEIETLTSPGWEFRRNQIQEPISATLDRQPTVEDTVE